MRDHGVAGLPGGMLGWAMLAAMSEYEPSPEERMTLREMVGKEVQIYPFDHDRKFGVVEEVTDAGVVFRITRSSCSSFTVGATHFIAFSARLSFALV